jgi:hypothetical protein
MKAQKSCHPYKGGENDSRVHLCGDGYGGADQWDQEGRNLADTVDDDWVPNE